MFIATQDIFLINVRKQTRHEFLITTCTYNISGTFQAKVTIFQVNNDAGQG